MNFKESTKEVSTRLLIERNGQYDIDAKFPSAQPLAPQELAYISSLGRSFSGGKSLFQVMPDVVVCARPNGGQYPLEDSEQVLFLRKKVQAFKQAIPPNNKQRRMPCIAVFSPGYAKTYFGQLLSNVFAAEGSCSATLSQLVTLSSAPVQSPRSTPPALVRTLVTLGGPQDSSA